MWKLTETRSHCCRIVFHSKPTTTPAWTLLSTWTSFYSPEHLTASSTVRLCHQVSVTTQPNCGTYTLYITGLKKMPLISSEASQLVLSSLTWSIYTSQRNDFSWTPYNTYVCRKNKWFGGTKLKKKKRKKTENFPETERQWSKNVSEALHMHKATFQPLIKKTWRQTQNRCSRLQYASVTVNKSWTLLNYTKHWEQGLC